MGVDISVSTPFFREVTIMKNEYSLIDRNLIRRFGKIIVILDESVGDRFVRENKAKKRGSGTEKEKSLHFPPSNKAIFYPPEEKTFEEIGNDNSIVRYPGPKDKLFSHIAK
jgi:hypothetical protein